MRMISPTLPNALFSKVRQCVLALLYGQPDRSFHDTKISVCSSQGAQRIAGLVLDTCLLPQYAALLVGLQFGNYPEMISRTSLLQAF